LGKDLCFSAAGYAPVPRKSSTNRLWFSFIFSYLLAQAV